MNDNSQNNFRNKEFKEALDEEPKKTENQEIDEEFEDSSTQEDANRKKIEQEQFRAKMLKLFGVVIVGLIVVLGIGFIISLFSKKDYTYADVEDIMKNAAVNYFEENPKKLPSTTDESLEVNVSILVDNKNMKELDHYLSNQSCKGNVLVDKVSNKEYTYTPYLKCGTDYETTTFYNAIKNKEKIVTSGYGLYAYNGEYIYRGTDVNNYVRFSDSDRVFRVVKITNDNKIVVIQEEASDNNYPWDERYNQIKDNNTGINEYKNSEISDILNYYYKGKIGKENSEKYDDYEYNEESKFLTKEDMKKLVNFKSCIGKRSSSDTSKDGSTECSTTYETKIGLLPVYDFLNASIDPNCTTTISASCQNYNYLANDTRYWLANGCSDNTDEVYLVLGNSLDSTKASSNASIRPIIQLSEKVMLEKGKGTINNPYVIR